MLSYEKTQETPMYTIFLNIHGSEKQRYAEGQHLRDLYKKDLNLKRHRREGNRSGGPVSRRWPRRQKWEARDGRLCEAKGAKSSLMKIQKSKRTIVTKRSSLRR